MGRSHLDSNQREVVIRYIADMGVVTVEQLSDHFDVSKGTIRDWVKQLLGEDLIRKHPFVTSKREHQFVIQDWSNDSISALPLTVILESKQLTIIELIDTLSRGKGNLGAFPALLAQRVLQSYYPVGSSGEAMRGTDEPLELRSLLRSIHGQIQEVLNCIEQVIAMRGVWEDSQELANRAGVLDLHKLELLQAEWERMTGKR